MWNLFKRRVTELPPGVSLHITARKPDGTIEREIRILDSGSVDDSAGTALSMSRDAFEEIKRIATKIRSEPEDPRRSMWSARFVSSQDVVLLEICCPEPPSPREATPAWSLFAHILGKIDPVHIRRLEDERRGVQPVRVETLARALADRAAVSVTFHDGSAYHQGFVSLTLGSDGTARVERRPQLFPPSQEPPTTLDTKLPADTLRDALKPLLEDERWPEEKFPSPGSEPWKLVIVLPAAGGPLRRVLSSTRDHPTVQRLRAAIALAENSPPDDDAPAAPATRTDIPCPFCAHTSWETMVSGPCGLLLRCSCSGMLVRGNSPAETATLLAPELMDTQVPSPDQALRLLQDGDRHVKILGPSLVAYRAWTADEYVEQVGPCPWCDRTRIHDVLMRSWPITVFCSCGGTAFILRDPTEAADGAACHFSTGAPIEGQDPWAPLKERGVLLGPSGPTANGLRWRGWFRRPEDEPLQAELMSFLKAVEREEVTLEADEQPRTFFGGDMTYRASNGWKVAVFLDAGEWDYFESIVTSDGRVLDYDTLAKLPWIRNYVPAPRIRWRAWGIPHTGTPKNACWPGAP